MAAHRKISDAGYQRLLAVAKLAEKGDDDHAARR